MNFGEPDRNEPGLTYIGIVYLWSNFVKRNGAAARIPA